MEAIDADSFERLVGNALDSLPVEIGRLIDNVVVVVEDRHPSENLLGLYEGTPRTERADYGGLAMPDMITLYRLAHCEAVDDLDDLVNEIQVTMVHEVAHHFGFDDDQLHELGYD